MNKLFSLLAVMLFLVPYLVFADVSCQYKYIGTYNETELLLVDNSNNNQGDIPKFSDFITEENNITSFIIYNPNSFKILVYLNFTIEGFGGGGKSYGIDIKPLQNRKVEELCYANDKSGYCFINESSISYFVSTPDSPNLSILYPKNLTLTKTKLILNKPCLTSSDCGTGICNSAGYCSNTTIIECCPEGKVNCNNLSCLQPSTRKAGETYSCVFECESGVGKDSICKLLDGVNQTCTRDSDCYSNHCNWDNYCGQFNGCRINGTFNCKNKKCVQPSIKKYHDTYNCVEECKSGVGDGQLCKFSIKNIILNITYIILSLGLIIFLVIYFYKIGKGTKIVIGAKKKAKKKAREINKKAQNEAEETINKAKQTAIRLIEQAEDNIIKIKKEIQQKEEIKKQLLEDLEALEDKSKEAIRKKEKLVKTNQDISELISNEHEKIKQLLEYYEKRHGHKFILDNGYIRFEKSWVNPSEKGEFFHIWWFETNHRRKVKSGYQIHHKDFNKLNNDLSNLEQLTPEEHKQEHYDKYK